jgi:hypothetical protein
MRYGLLFALLFLFGYNGFAQPYQIGHITATFIDAGRSGRSVSTEIYYPADVAGDDVTFSSAISGKVPAISFGHGFVMTYDAYFNIRNAVVANGYIIAFPTTEGSFSPSHDEFAKDLAFVLKSVALLGSTSSSVLYDKVDTMNCVMGHSMGGGAAFLAAAADNTIKSIATMAAAETTPSAIAASAAVVAPGLVFAGINDCVCPPATNQLPMYSGLASSCKQYIGIIGGSHCQMANSSVTCSFGEATCTPAPTISVAVQQAVIDTYLVPWLNYHLKGDCTAGSHFDAKLVADAAIDYQKNCSLCATGSVAGTGANPVVRVYPNPCRDALHVSLPSGKHYRLSILTMAGTQVYSGELDTDAVIPLHGIANGVFLYQLVGADTNQNGIVLKQ